MRRQFQLVGFRRKNFWERSQDAEELLLCSQASTHAVVPACMSLWPSSMQTSGFKMFHSKAVAPKIGCPCRFPTHAPATQRPLIGRPASCQTRCTVLARPDTVSGALDVSLPSYRTTYTHNQLRLQLCRHGMPNLCIKTHAHNWKVGDDMGNAAVQSVHTVCKRQQYDAAPSIFFSRWGCKPREVIPGRAVLHRTEPGSS